MKKVILLFVFLLLISTTTHADPINILSETYHIWGCAGPGNCYDATSTGFPISQGIGYQWEGSNHTEFAYSGASAGDFGVSTNVGGFGSQLKAEGEASILFEVSSTAELMLDLFVGGSMPMIETDCSVFLIDTLSSGNMLSIQHVSDLFGAWQMDYYFNSQYSFTVIPGKVYELALYSRSTSAEDTWCNSVSASINIAPVPEPATMLLFGTGILGLVGSRLRRKIK